LLSSQVKACGVNSLPWCEPSQKGCLLLWPQVQKKYLRSFSSATLAGRLSAIVGFVISISGDSTQGGCLMVVNQDCKLWPYIMAEKKQPQR
jgi:hypothetical protein